nr:FkbM family methyltransferase [Methanobrevibacter arboriphilus]
MDVGANIGDSSLYFANKGYNVFGFEPISEVYDIATGNINLNPQLKDKITLINKAVSCKKGRIKIYKDSENSGGHSGYGSNKEYEEFDLVETTTLGDIINEYNIDPYALKIDCEGCEVDIIMNSDLSDFKIIYFEHHKFLTGINHENLVNKLKSEGFMIVGENKFNKQVDTICMINNFK